MADWINEREDEFYEDDSQEMLPFDYDRVEVDRPLAWLLLIGKEKMWFPKSRCCIDEDTKTISVPRWLAYEKNLI